MSDVHTVQTRSYNMSRIRCRDTKPEMVVRKLVHALGHRFRLQGKYKGGRLPGRPDLVFAKLKKVIEVRGCFWHRHSCPLGRPMPRTRPEFWSTKFAGNVRRDHDNERTLRADGWGVLVIWQCETTGDLDTLADRITSFLTASSPDRSRPPASTGRLPRAR